MKSTLFQLVPGIVLSSFVPLLATEAPPSTDPHYAVIILLKDRDKPLSAPDEVEVARLLRRGDQEYLVKLNSVTFLSFRQQRGLSAEQAVLLKTEVDSVKENLSALLPFYDGVEKNQEPFSVLAWLAIAQTMSTNAPLMDDIGKVGLVESEWPTALKLSSRGIFERLINPKVATLVKKAQCASDKAKGARDLTTR